MSVLLNRIERFIKHSVEIFAADVFKLVYVFIQFAYLIQCTGKVFIVWLLKYYIVNDYLLVYGSVASGFKAGGFGDYVDRGDGVFINFPYEPEDNTTFELGFKASLLGGDLK